MCLSCEKIIFCATQFKSSLSCVSCTLSGVIVNAFDGCKSTIISEVDLSILIRPHVFQVTFNLMDIHRAYNCLFGKTLDTRCWGSNIHSSSDIQVCQEWKAGNDLWWAGFVDRSPFLFPICRCNEEAVGTQF